MATKTEALLRLQYSFLQFSYGMQSVVNRMLRTKICRQRADVDRYRDDYCETGDLRIRMASEVAELSEGYESKIEMLRNQWHYNLEERVKLEEQLEERREWTAHAVGIIERMRADRARMRAEVARYREAYCERDNLLVEAERLRGLLFQVTPCEGNREKWTVCDCLDGCDWRVDDRDGRCHCEIDGWSDSETYGG